MPGFHDRFSRTDFFSISDSGYDSRGPIPPTPWAWWTPRHVAHRRDGLAGPAGLIDTVPGDTSTTAVLTVGAPPIVSAIDTIADEDFYQITLVAGHAMRSACTYSEAPAIRPARTVPLLDSYIESTRRTAICSPRPMAARHLAQQRQFGVRRGADFHRETSGTYYVNARAFDQTRRAARQRRQGRRLRPLCATK